MYAATELMMVSHQTFSLDKIINGEVNKFTIGRQMSGLPYHISTATLVHAYTYKYSYLGYI